jgi:Transcriptional regulator, AbiEi antitoxin
VSVSLPDPDWYLDHVVVPSGPDRSPVGPIRAWQAQWAARARELASRGDDLTALAVGQGFVVTRSQVRAAGVSDAEVRRLVRNGTWATPRHGVLSIIPDADGVGRATAATAAALVRPGHVISHRSAAVLHGLPLLWPPPMPELTACAHSTLGRRTRVAQCRGARRRAVRLVRRAGHFRGPNPRERPCPW